MIVMTPSRRGFTILELLIATLISLMVMGATVTLFGVVGDRITSGRAMIETNDRIRAAQNLLRLDLVGRTSSMFPWEQPGAGNGYFEIVKGPYRDQFQKTDANGNLLDTMTGYTRDALLFTTRSKDRPFVGRFNGTTVESNVAEVAWFLQPMINTQGTLVTIANPNLLNNPSAPPIQLYALYRRMLLVAPGVTMPSSANSANNWANYFDSYDVSAHLDFSNPNGRANLIPNSLQDLTYRENRFAHDYTAAPPSGAFPVVFPNLVLGANTTPTNISSLTPFPQSDPRYGEDVVLTNVVSFDIKVWDPQAVVKSDGTVAPIHPLVPSDVGYNANTATTINSLQAGAYVDLFYNYNPQTNSVPGTATSYFAGPAYGSGVNSYLDATNPKARDQNGLAVATFDNWCSGYEYYLNANAPIGRSVNGFDNDGQNGVGDPGERASSPPYPVPLRGVQINLRVYEPSSRQVREATVDESFLPD
jgi:hypothetical protein